MVLDMSRGKFGQKQIELSKPILDCLSSESNFFDGETDCRNYGGLEGIESFRRLVGAMLGASAENIVAGGNSSLEMMFKCVSTFFNQGVSETDKPWREQGKIKFICPVPGYDRHFTICEYWGIDMIPVEFKDNKLDIGKIEEIASTDENVKGMWCVPIFSNPTGTVYSDDDVRRLAKMSAAHDFRIFWDNAYSVHAFRGENPKIPNILEECEKAGNADRVVEFMSFSKISLCGAGVASLATSMDNKKWLLKRLFAETVGPDKINQLRHARFFKTVDDVKAHMRKMGDILRPKFDLTEEIFNHNLKGVGEWTSPDGGYFVSLNLPNGTAAKTVEKCRTKGLIVTGAGAAYPYKKDPLDRNIRIAPSYPSLEELEQALNVFCETVKEVTEK